MDGIAGCPQQDVHLQAGADLGRVNVDLPDVQRVPPARPVDEQVDHRIDGVLAGQVVVEPQVVDPRALQLVQQPQGLARRAGNPGRPLVLEVADVGASTCEARS